MGDFELSNGTSTFAVPAELLEEAESRALLKERCIFWFEGVLLPVAGSIGLLGNLLSILVLKGKDLDMTASFVNLLCTLCVFDSLFIVAVNLFYTLPLHSAAYDRDVVPYLSPALLPLVHIVLTGSVYSVVAVAVERYWIICDPFHRGVAVSHTSSGKRFIVTLVVFSVVYNLNKFFEVTVGSAVFEEDVWRDDLGEFRAVNVTRAVVEITELRNNPTYLRASIIVNFIVMVVLPLLVLSVCHILTFRKIRENTLRHNAISTHQKRDDAMAMLFFIIILFFVVCHSGKFVLNFYEISQLFYDEEHKKWPLWAFLLTRINHFLLVVNSSVNFFIYCFRDAKFRGALIKLLGLKRLLARGSGGDGPANLDRTVATQHETIELVSKGSPKRNGSRHGATFV